PVLPRHSSALGAVFVLTETRRQDRVQLDVLGAVLATAGLVALVYGLSAAATHGWTDPSTLGPLIGGVGLLLVFLLAQARVRSPLLPLPIVAHRSRGGAYLSFVLIMVGMFGMFLFVSFYLQTVAGYTPLQTGVAFLPFAAGVLGVSVLIGRIITRFPARVFLATGLLLAAAGMAWLTQLGIDGRYTQNVLPAVLLIGSGLGTMSPAAANLATLDVAAHESGVASAVLNASEQVGASVGLALLNTVAASQTTAYLAAHPGHRLAGLVDGYTAATAWGSGILATGAIVVLALVNTHLGQHHSRLE
ncbi:MAG: MFS transporter, partial [Nocardioidaceae bacterium]